MLQCNLWSHNPVLFFCCLVSCGPSNLLRRPPTLSLWPLPICGALLVVYLPVALRAGASALLDWMHSYPVCRVGEHHLHIILHECHKTVVIRNSLRNVPSNGCLSPVDPSNGCLSLSPARRCTCPSGRRWPRPRQLQLMSHFVNSKLAHAFT